MLIQPWRKVMYSLYHVSLYIRTGIRTSHLSIPSIVVGVIYAIVFNKKKISPSRCFNYFKSMLLLLSLSFSLLLFFYYFFYLLIFLFFFFFAFGFTFFFYFWLNGSFSHMKWLRLVDYFVCLFVCSVSWAVIIVGYCRVTIHNHVASTNSSPVPKRFTIFLIDFYFNITLHFILNFSLFFCHSLDYEFTLTDFMGVTSEHDVFVAP